MRKQGMSTDAASNGNKRTAADAGMKNIDLNDSDSEEETPDEVNFLINRQNDTEPFYFSILILHVSEIYYQNISIFSRFVYTKTDSKIAITSQNLVYFRSKKSLGSALQLNIHLDYAGSFVIITRYYFLYLVQ